MGIQFPEGFVILGGESPIENIQTNFREDARGIISRVAFLIGVPRKFLKSRRSHRS